MFEKKIMTWIKNPEPIIIEGISKIDKLKKVSELINKENIFDFIIIDPLIENNDETILKKLNNLNNKNIFGKTNIIFIELCEYIKKKHIVHFEKLIKKYKHMIFTTNNIKKVNIKIKRCKKILFDIENEKKISDNVVGLVSLLFFEKNRNKVKEIIEKSKVNLTSILFLLGRNWYKYDTDYKILNDINSLLYKTSENVLKISLVYLIKPLEKKFRITF